MRIDSAATLPQHLLSWSIHDGELLPDWLSARDRPWLRDLLAIAMANTGRPLRELRQRLRECGDDARAGRRLAMARHCLLAVLARAAGRTLLPARLRALVFATAGEGDPAVALAAAANALGVDVATATTMLFGDVVWQRPVQVPRDLTVPRLELLVDRALARGLLRTALAATLSLRGSSRAVLQTAWLHGGGLEVSSVAADGARIAWRAGSSAAVARCRRALLAVLPVLPWTRQFELRARCAIGGRDAVLVLGPGDPLLPGPEPRVFDSALERRFAVECAAVAPAWELLREPVPCVLAPGGGATAALAFPDFELRDRRGGRRDGRRALVEIAGLRDLGALPRKLALLAALPQLVLCLPRRAVPTAFAAHPRVVPFDRRLDVQAVLAAVERAAR